MKPTKKIMFFTVMIALAIAIIANPAAGQPPLPPLPKGNIETAYGGKNMNQLLDDVGMVEAAFGGMFLDPAEDVLYVYLTDTSREKAAVAAAIAQIFGDHFVPSGGVRVLQAQYSMRQLQEWYEPFGMKLATIPGVTSIDLAEQHNRLAVSVVDLTLRPVIEEELKRLGIPLEAVIIEEIPYAVEDAHTVRGVIRPVVGGVQVSISGVGGPCTLGFLTIKDGTPGYIVPHHCTKTRGSVDGDSVYQPAQSPSNLLGQETIDPQFFPCARGPKCRYSQGSFIDHDGVVTRDDGYLARTLFNDIAIDHSEPWFRIRSERLFSVGTIVHKIGRTTGWTSGQVTVTCVDIPVLDFWYLCQDKANYARQGGDSGAPVFERDATWPTEVHIGGMHWGVHGGQPVYSYIGNIYWDLGKNSVWDTCWWGYGC
ncbi:MAG: hypothetical protein ACE5IZ_08015 [Dehalococcoidia bacterium]